MEGFLEGHTLRRYDGELNHLHLLVLEMGGLVIEQCLLALDALKGGDLDAAREVIRRETRVDALELRLDDDVWWEVGRRGPVARDLRAVMTFSKAVTDLERIGDEAARIAHITLDIYNPEAPQPSPRLMRDVQTMGKLAVGMLREAVGLFDSFDEPAARALLQRSPDLDAEFQSSLRRVTTFILEDARNVGHAVSVVVLVKSLERIGDHARNLAEYVIYLIRGEDVRHPEAREQANAEGKAPRGGQPGQR
jgi:phosphate transport system protein